MYNITINNIPLNVCIETYPEQKGGLETQPLEGGYQITEVLHKGEDIYSLIGNSLFNDITKEVDSKIKAEHEN